MPKPGAGLLTTMILLGVAAALVLPFGWSHQSKSKWTARPAAAWTGSGAGSKANP